MGVLGVNHLAFRTPDPDGLRRSYLELTGAEEWEGEHRPLRLGQTLLVFFQSEHASAAADPDEIAFDVDGPGFTDVLERAHRLGCAIRGPLEHTASSRGFYLSDPDRRPARVHARRSRRLLARLAATCSRGPAFGNVT